MLLLGEQHRLPEAFDPSRRPTAHLGEQFPDPVRIGLCGLGERQQHGGVVGRLVQEMLQMPRQFRR